MKTFHHLLTANSSNITDFGKSSAKNKTKQKTKNAGLVKSKSFSETKIKCERFFQNFTELMESRKAIIIIVKLHEYIYDLRI